MPIKKLIVGISLLIAAVGTVHAQSSGLAGLLARIKAADKDLLAVSEEDGRFLRLMVVTSRATHALEIGGANGYSAIWIGLGLRETGGHLTTIEYDRGRAKIAEIPKVGGPVDFVFLDAWKRDYKRFYDLVLPRLQPHGLFLAHNVVNKQTEMRDFLAAIQNNASVYTSIVSPGNEGMSVTIKLR
jgi:caffeoyl-CoA O-methyltransferase